MLQQVYTDRLRTDLRVTPIVQIYSLYELHRLDRGVVECIARTRSGLSFHFQHPLHLMEIAADFYAVDVNSAGSALGIPGY